MLLGFWEILLPRVGLGVWAARSRAERLHKIAVRFRLLAIEMGGVLIKVGQFLSSRVDVLPKEITEELSGLQDEVPAERFEDIRLVAEADLGMSLEQRFVCFDPAASAAASLGQVHRATIVNPIVGNNSQASGEEDRFQQVDVIVKVQRPNIEAIITTDLAAIKTVSRWLQKYPPIRKRANVPDLVQEFSKILFEEIDYLAEGKNIEIFQEHFLGYPGVRVPKVIWSHTTRRVLTLEDVSGIKIDDYQVITKAGISREEVASRVLEIYFKQIFEDGFFHADPHPGNLFVRPVDGNGQGNWELVFVDFGMVGTITPDNRLALRDMLIAFGTRDSHRLVRSYQKLKILLPGADLDLLNTANERAFELFYGRNMSEFKNITPEEITQLLIEFRDLVYQLPFQVPQNLIFLARAVGLLSGLCTGLYPDLNIWDHMVPYASKMLLQESSNEFLSGLPEGIREWLGELGGIVQKLVALPGRTEAILARVERGELVTRDPQLAEQVRRLSVAVQRAGGGVIFSAMLISGVLLFMGGQVGIAIGLGVAAGVVLVWVLAPRW